MRIKVLFNEDKKIIKLNEDEKRLGLNFDNFQQITLSKVERYNGAYIVVPKTNSQILKTNQKLMNDDVTVKEIPYFEVSNDNGGVTVYIGKEITVNGN